MVGKALRQRLRARLSPRLRRRHLLRLHLSGGEADLPEPLEAAGVTAFSDAVWVVGLNAPSASRPALDKVWFYKKGWQSGPKLPVRLDSVSVASDGERLFVIGGRTTDSRVGTRRSAGTCGSLTVPTMRAGKCSTGSQKNARVVPSRGMGSGWSSPEGWPGTWTATEKRKASTTPTCGSGRANVSGAKSANCNDRGKTWWLPATGTAGMVSRRCRCSEEDPRVPLGAVDLVKRPHHAAIDIDPVRSSAAVWLADRGVCLFGGVTRTTAEPKNSREQGGLRTQDREPVSDLPAIAASDPSEGPAWVPWGRARR